MAHKNLSIFGSEEKELHCLPTAHHWKLFVDGAARNNPGPAGAGIYVTKNDKPFKKLGFYLGTKTNNQAEYGALIIGLYYLKQWADAHDHIDIISDSQLLVRQFKGEYRVKHPELKPLHLLAKHLLKDTHHAIAHVLREHNEMADAMANKGIDGKKSLPRDVVAFLHEHGIIW